MHATRPHAWASASRRSARLGEGDLLAFHLLLYSCFDPRFHLVGVGARVEAIGSLLVDELLGQLQLRIPYFRILHFQVAQRLDFRCALQLVQNEGVSHGTQNDYVVPATRRPTAYPASLALTQSRRKQCVWFGTALVGCQVVRRVELARVYLGQGHELLDVDTLGAGLLERLDLLRGDHDVLVFGELVALHV